MPNGGLINFQLGKGGNERAQRPGTQSIFAKSGKGPGTLSTFVLTDADPFEFFHR